MTPAAEGARAILDFWFGEIGPQRWWVRSAGTDAAIIARFRALWDEWRALPAERFLETPHLALAAALLFDQFPRNMFRHQAAAFASDGLALAIARAAIDREFDDALDPAELSFLYMPFMHSEALADQQRSIILFATLGRDEPLAFAHLHHDMIARYCRFPARNAALGRADRPGEAEAIAASRDW